jgi:HK97 family phage prohead protease
MDRMKIAAFDATATVADTEDGTFTALVAVFGNVDSQGDIIDPGAFTDTLADWKAKGQPIPVIWSHEWQDPFSHIGGVTDAAETEKGLQITGQLDLENPTAAQVYKLMKSGRVAQFSFVARAAEGGWSLETQEDGAVVSHLSKLDLYEVGPTLRGANQETQLLSIKSDIDALVSKEGRVLAQKHVDVLKDVHAQLGDIIAAVEKASPPGEEKKNEASDKSGAFSLPAAKAQAQLMLALAGGKES